MSSEPRPTFPETLSKPTDVFDPAQAATLPPVGPIEAPAANRRIVGDYELLDKIAQGGMGVVYRARQISLNRVVAVKMILSGQFATETAVQRFRQEAESAAGLDHPNVLPIHEVGDHDGCPYFSMRLVHGGSLADRMKSLADDPRSAVALLEKVARGVHFAHQRGILHRDLKPGNVLLDADGTPFITDFGLAKKTTGDSDLTISGAVVGTPSYMAPEQARGDRAITTSVDIYALAAILYEMLAGRPPFVGESIAQTLRQVEEQEATPPSVLKPTCDRDLEAIALKGLEKDAAQRYETAGAFADELACWLRGEPVAARRAGPIRRAKKWIRRNPAITVLSTTAILLLVAGSIVSSVYAVKAGRRADEAAASERDARDQEAAVKDREELLKNTLAQSAYRQARAERLIARNGWRSRSLSLIKTAVELLDRPRDATDTRVNLPTMADLRVEAAMTLLGRDVELVREVSISLAGTALFSGDGKRFIEDRFFDESGKARFRVVELLIGTEALVGPVDTFSGGMLAVNHDGTRAVASHYGLDEAVDSLDVLEIASAKLIARLTAPRAKDPKPKSKSGEFHRAWFSPDGTRLLAVRRRAGQSELLVWELARPDQPRQVIQRAFTPKPVEFEQGGITSVDFLGVSFAPDSKRVAFVGENPKVIRVVDVSTHPPTRLADLTMPERVEALTWHPAGTSLAVVLKLPDNRFQVVGWDLATNRSTLVYPTNVRSSRDRENGGASIAFSPDGQWLAFGGGSQPSVSLMDAHGGDELVQLNDVSIVGVSKAFWLAPDLVATVGAMESIKVWRLTAPFADERYPNLRPMSRPVFSADGRLLVAFTRSSPAVQGVDRLTIVDRQTRKTVNVRLDPPMEGKDGLLLSPDHRHAVVIRDKEIAAYETTTGAEAYRKSVPKEPGPSSWQSGYFDPAGRLYVLATTVQGKEAKTEGWDVSAGKAVFRVIPGNSEATVISRNGNWCFTAQMMTLAVPDLKIERQPARLYELPAGRLAAEFELEQVAANEFSQYARVSDDGRYAIGISANTDPKATGSFTDRAVWALRALPSGKIHLRFPLRNPSDHAVDFSADSRYLALASDNQHVEYWDVDAKELRFRWQPLGGKMVSFVAIAPDGSMATGSEEEDSLRVLRVDVLLARLKEMGLGW